MSKKTTAREEAKLYSRLLARVKPYKYRLVFSMFLMAVAAGTQGALAWLVKDLSDGIFMEKNQWMLYMVPVVVIVLYAVKGLSSYGQTYMMSYVGNRIVTEFRVELYTHLQRMPLGYFDRVATGELMSRITNDVNLIQGAVSNVVTGVFKDLFTAVALIAVVIYRDPMLSIVALGVFPVCVIPLVKLGRRLRRISTSSQETMADVNVLLHETIGGARIVKGFCREDHEARRFTREAYRLFDLRMKDVSTRAISSPLMEFLGGLAIAGIIFYGGWQVISGQSTPGTFFSFLTALIMLYEPVKRMSNLNNEIQNGLAAAERVYQVLDTEPEIVDAPDAIQLPPMSRAVELKDVHFAYSAEKGEVLKGVSLLVPKGQAVALVGTSGGGKTTLVNLLPRFYEVTSGAVLIDDLDIRRVTMRSLRRQISIVTQQTILFNDTVRENIAYGRPEASDEEIVEAARAAYALDFIERMPQKFDTRIGEAGVMLSGGERQRLSIARAILADRPILILDEATSSLDTESELYVQKALENLMRGRTTFVIAHRLSTVQRADRIVVVSGGKIVEEGRHEELLTKGGLYCKLHRMQFQIDSGLEGLESAGDA
ncbi:lipid A export permease/ATP-binding protein MsbA [Desulfarculus baarsii]